MRDLYFLIVVEGKLNIFFMFWEAWQFFFFLQTLLNSVSQFFMSFSIYFRTSLNIRNINVCIIGAVDIFLSLLFGLLVAYGPLVHGNFVYFYIVKFASIFPLYFWIVVTFLLTQM